MRLDRIAIVTRREYLAKVRSKGYWIGTVAFPLLLATIFVLPTLLLTKTKADQRLVIVDETGLLGRDFVAGLADVRGPGGELARFDAVLDEPAGDREAQRRELDRRVLEGELDAWVRVSSEGLGENRIEYHAESVSNFLTQEVLEDRFSEVVRRHRLESAGLDPEEIGTLTRSVRLATVRVTEEGGKEEGAEAGIVLALVLFFMLYMALIFYGQQVMNGVLEEKGSRVVEVMLSKVRPFELMMGKLLGICGAAFTQLAIWLVSVAVLTLPGVVASMAWIPEEFDVPALEPALALHFFAFFLLGFLVYATFYASIGAAFNDVQEAQQFASYAVIVLVAPVFFLWMVINNPDSTLSVVASLIPPFTPLLMLLRLSVKAPPLWQVALAYLLTTAFTWAMVWVASRIYRVGILMHGKKPTLPELWRWVRHA